ncbi:MAG: hypothetical protein LAN71_17315 [Acidobacteriia bacterium]|nr:hypothetical protein [Terriglobia bacterium]
MMNWVSTEVISDWLNYLDSVIIPEKGGSELWHNSKSLVLDSIEVFEYIRKATDNIPINQDNRFQKLLDICMQNCRNEYYQRFLGYKGIYYHNIKPLWWIDCWQSIRLINILHELNIQTIDAFFDTSDGKRFREKWGTFFGFALSEMMGANSLPSFSYLECIRFLINMGRDIPYTDLNDFLTKLSEKNGSSLRLFPNSNEIRAQAIYTIDRINEKWPGRYDFNGCKSNLLNNLEELLTKSKWDEFSFTWTPNILKISENRIINLIKAKIPINGSINSAWVNGNNFSKKGRYAFLLLAADLKTNKKYFELIEPNRFAYIPSRYIENYKYIGNVVDNVIQGFKDIEDIQKKIQDQDITEGYFRDILGLGVKGAIANNENIKWETPERVTNSGRITDISINVRSGPEIPIEAKLLWRFREGYEPIGEVLEQLNTGNLGITFVINPPNNPSYMSKYKNFEGWMNFVKDHPTYILGSIRNFNNQFEANAEFKSKHFFSDHHHRTSDGREKNVTLLNFFIDLQDYIRSPKLAKL